MVRKKDHEQQHSRCGKTLFDILNYPVVYVDVPFTAMVPAIFQVPAEFPNKVLQYINCRAQNAVVSCTRAPGQCLHHVYGFLKRSLEMADGKFVRSTI